MRFASCVVRFVLLVIRVVGQAGLSAIANMRRGQVQEGRRTRSRMRNAG
jgi:hypothetical protein